MAATTFPLIILTAHFPVSSITQRREMKASLNDVFLGEFEDQFRPFSRIVCREEAAAQIKTFKSLLGRAQEERMESNYQY
jgi:hypothetical protein